MARRKERLNFRLDADLVHRMRFHAMMADLHGGMTELVEKALRYYMDRNKPTVTCIWCGGPVRHFPEDDSYLCYECRIRFGEGAHVWRRCPHCGGELWDMAWDGKRICRKCRRQGRVLPD